MITRFGSTVTVLASTHICDGWVAVRRESDGALREFALSDRRTETAADVALMTRLMAEVKPI